MYNVVINSWKKSKKSVETQMRNHFDGIAFNTYVINWHLLSVNTDWMPKFKLNWALEMWGWGEKSVSGYNYVLVFHLSRSFITFYHKLQHFIGFDNRILNSHWSIGWVLCFFSLTIFRIFVSLTMLRNNIHFSIGTANVCLCRCWTAKCVWNGAQFQIDIT